MGHRFLIEAGRWSLEGNWLERNNLPTLVQGRLLIAWSQDNWFTMATKLIFPESDLPEIALQYRGRLDGEERHYNYVLQHSQLGRVEGEGWIGPENIVQRYWALSDQQRRSGFETFHQLNQNTYNLASGILSGHYLTSTMEAKLVRQY